MMKKKTEHTTLPYAKVIDVLLALYQGNATTVMYDIDMLYVMKECTAPDSAEALCQFFLRYDRKEVPAEEGFLVNKVCFHDPIKWIEYGTLKLRPVRLSLFILAVINWPDKQTRPVLLGYLLDVLVRLCDHQVSVSRNKTVKYYRRKLSQLCEQSDRSLKPS